MERIATFTITREKDINGWYYTMKCKAYNQYNKYDVPEKRFYDALEELTDIFNNVIGIGVVFEIG